MKFKKLQGGGFLTFTPVISSQGEKPSTGSKSEEKKSGNGILDDTTYKELVNNGGLINDVNNFVKQLSTLQNSSANPFSNPTNTSSALQLISKVNEMRQNRVMWEKALEHNEKENSSGEVAVGASGEVYVKDKDNKIQSMSVSSYLKNKDKVQILTNTELLMERQMNPQLTNQFGIINVAGSSIGMNKITDHISAIISKFGQETTNNTRAYSKDQVLSELGKATGKKPTAEEARGIETLMSIASTPGDYYKVTQNNSSERRQAMKGAAYIWRTLGEGAQKKLTATAALNGVESPTQFIIDMISTQTDESSTSEITPIDDPTKEGKIKAAVTADITPFELFHNGKLGKKIIPWNDPSTGKTFNLVATGVSKLMGMDGKPIGANTLSNVLKTENGSVVNSNKAFFGDKKIDLNDMNKLVYDGELAMRVYAPVSSDGGPDYHKLEELKKLEEQISKNPQLSSNQINDIYAQRGFSYVKVGENKEYIMNSRFQPFLMFSGYGTDEMKVTKENSKIQPLTGDEEDLVKEKLKEVWTEAKVKEPTGHLYTNYYKGMIAIPYVEDSSIYTTSIAKNLNSAKSNLTDARIKQEKSKGTVLSANSQSIW